MKNLKIICIIVLIFGLSILLSACNKPNVEIVDTEYSDSLSSSKIGQLKKLESYCGWRSKDDTDKWIYGEGYYSYNPEDGSVVRHYILNKGEYTEVSGFELNPCLCQLNDGTKVYYGDIILAKRAFPNSFSPYFDSNEEVNMVAVSQICPTNRSDKGLKQCDALGYFIGDGVEPIPDRNYVKVNYYPESKRDKLNICKDYPDYVCPSEYGWYYEMPGTKKLIYPWYEVIGNIYDNENLLIKLSGLGENAKSYFDICRAKIGQIFITTYE